MVAGLINANPVVYEKKERRTRTAPSDVDEYAVEAIDELEIFDILLYLFNLCLYGLSPVFNLMEEDSGVHQIPSDLREFDIKDPEHPYSLEELKVISEDAIEVDDNASHDYIYSDRRALQHGNSDWLMLKGQTHALSTASVQKVDIRVAPGTHATEDAVNKQLNDKERVAAALENPNLVDMVDECLAPSYG
ncbi:hypothetical protein OROMI_008938 [Orobanche minor]